jgi:hypothetical protein
MHSISCSAETTPGIFGGTEWSPASSQQNAASMIPPKTTEKEGETRGPLSSERTILETNCEVVRFAISRQGF